LGKLNLKELHFNTLKQKRSNHFNRTIKHNFKAAYYHYKDRIEQSPLISNSIEQTPLTKYSNKAVTNVCGLKHVSKIGIFQANIEQNRSEKKELLERKIGGKKSKIDSSRQLRHHLILTLALKTVCTRDTLHHTR